MSQIDDINRVVFNYINKENVKSALLINGKWGSGKTYYVNETLIPRIKKQFSDTKVIYLSLYGIKSIEELKLNLYIEIIPDNKLVNKIKSPGFKSITSSISQIWDINLSSVIGKISPSVFFKDNAKYVLIFDDLERTDDQLGIKSVLGWINNFVEHLGFRTVLIGDESNITEIDIYSNIKEKLVGTTVKFEPPKNILNEINENILDKDDVGELIHSQEVLIKQLYNFGADQNLRSYEFSIDNLKYILSILDDVVEELTDEVLRKLIIYTLALSFEYKKGIITEENLEQLEVDDFDRLIGIADMIQVADEERIQGDISINEIVNNYFKKFGYTIVSTRPTTS